SHQSRRFGDERQLALLRLEASQLGLGVCEARFSQIYTHGAADLFGQLAVDPFQFLNMRRAQSDFRPLRIGRIRLGFAASLLDERAGVEKRRRAAGRSRTGGVPEIVPAELQADRGLQLAPYRLHALQSRFEETFENILAAPLEFDIELSLALRQ